MPNLDELKRVCGNCHVHMGDKEPMNDPSITHGICDTCGPKLYGDELWDRVKAARKPTNELAGFMGEKQTCPACHQVLPRHTPGCELTAMSPPYRQPRFIDRAIAQPPAQPQFEDDKSDAGYRMTKEGEEGIQCHSCLSFMPGVGMMGTCRKVEGEIHPDATCHYFTNAVVRPPSLTKTLADDSVLEAFYSADGRNQICPKCESRWASVIFCPTCGTQLKEQSVVEQLIEAKQAAKKPTHQATRHTGPKHKNPVNITINIPKPKEKKKPKEPEPHPFLGGWNDAGSSHHPHNTMRPMYRHLKSIGMKHTGSQGEWHGFRNADTGEGAWVGKEKFIHHGQDGQARVGDVKRLRSFLFALKKRSWMKPTEAIEEAICELGMYEPRPKVGDSVYHTGSKKIGRVHARMPNGAYHIKYNDGSEGRHDAGSLGRIHTD